MIIACIQKFTRSTISLSQIRNTGSLKLNSSVDWIQQMHKNQMIVPIFLACLSTFDYWFQTITNSFCHRQRRMSVRRVKDRWAVFSHCDYCGYYNTTNPRLCTTVAWWETSKGQLQDTILLHSSASFISWCTWFSSLPSVPWKANRVNKADYHSSSVSTSLVERVTFSCRFTP